MVKLINKGQYINIFDYLPQPSPITRINNVTGWGQRRSKKITTYIIKLQHCSLLADDKLVEFAMNRPSSQSPVSQNDTMEMADFIIVYLSRKNVILHLSELRLCDYYSELRLWLYFVLWCIVVWVYRDYIIVCCLTVLWFVEIVWYII